MNGKLTAMFQDATLLALAQAATPTALNLTWSVGVYSLAFEIDEAILKLTGAPVNTPLGIWTDLDWEAYYATGSNASVVTATLINDVPNYTWT